MAKILAVGNATLDIINVVDDYPHEDQEVRASSQQFRRGGNACNTLAILSQLGHQCSWAGTLADEPDAAVIRADLNKHHINCSAVHTSPHGKVPTSYVTLNRLNGSRTIVHYRELAEYHFNDFLRIDPGQLEWVHFEGRNIGEVTKMMSHLRQEQPDLMVSLEVEKPREGIESLFPLADLLLFSKGYALHHGHHHAKSLLQHIAAQKLEVTASCTWGERGAWAIDYAGRVFHTPAFSPPLVVDTLGAGDTFNAGMIDQLLRGHELELALIEAARLAGKKCGVYGLENIFL
ncbi:MAG: PfkB family carbohydrate kinase [Chromatiales bacterium]|nr:PfkB family carbohydrate kinase [Chromatiales bacterium]